MKHYPVLFLKTQIAFFVNRVEDPCILNFSQDIEKGTLLLFSCQIYPESLVAPPAFHV